MIRTIDSTGLNIAQLVRRVMVCDRAGASIEFALVVPVFIAVVLAIANTVLIYLAQEGLESTAESASRLLLTGQAQTFQYYTGSTRNTGMTATQFANAICGTLTYSASAGASSLDWPARTSWWSRRISINS